MLLQAAMGVGILFPILYLIVYPICYFLIKLVVMIVRKLSNQQLPLHDYWAVRKVRVLYTLIALVAAFLVCFLIVAYLLGDGYNT
ncbi:hypothetical protein SAMN05444266_104143 [Chitinophaga jiangningensis]|uniref:Uncharacterized protein n=1 Tax=Chitinophaga jiangningensis TaxID=1419482 RepID=A0A1M7C035_9BACT|nr:hypothetical protein [Chitinophaga jiangningensis]SHL60581.1 hypothetical protein SAMN05444266_104143 [Chitinophaga jiangningensis]